MTKEIRTKKRIKIAIECLKIALKLHENKKQNKTKDPDFFRMEPLNTDKAIHFQIQNAIKMLKDEQTL